MTYIHLIDSDRCKGCGLCVRMPEKGTGNSDQVNTKGYFPAFQARPEDCIFCAICCMMCPDVAITITRRKRPGKCGETE